MSRAKKSKKLLHLVACYPDGYSSTLENDLRQAYTCLPKEKDRIFCFLGKTWHGLICEPRESYFVFQCATSIPGGAASVLPSAGVDEERVELLEQSAPEGKDFSGGDIICLVSGNNVFACCSGLREPAITHFIHALFSESSLSSESQMVQILPMANVDQIAMIYREGVKSIRTNMVLDATIYERVMNTTRGPMSILTHALFGQDSNLTEMAKTSHPKIQIEIGKSRQTGSSDMGWLQELATQTFEDEYPYMIITEKGTRLTNIDTKVSRTVS